MQIFPDSITIKILCPLTKSTESHKYIFVITEHFLKLACAVLLRSITALIIGKVFLRDLVFIYGPPAPLLMDKVRSSKLVTDSTGF